MREIKTWIATSSAQRLALYVAFIVYSLIRFLDAPGDDLSSSYIACRLLANGGSSHLYDFHPELFHVVDTAPWISTAADAQFSGFLHPYVQTPLWAWALQPLCTKLTFSAFSTIFLCIALLSLATTIEIVARAWADNFLRPFPLVFLLAAIALSTPFQYAMWLVQTHALFLMLTVAALYLAQRDRSFQAGALLALACAVKITPGLLAIYWLIGGRRQAALWFVLCSLGLALLTVVAVGANLTLDYVHSMRRVSNVLLVSFNNQSLVAWLASQSMLSELGSWRMLPLTPLLKIVSLIASLVGVAFAGWMSKRYEWAGASAALALIVITIFSPIAWTHYFLVLIPAVMILSNIGGVLPLMVAVITFILNTTPVAIDPIAPYLASMTMVRSHFISAVILMFVMALLCFRPNLRTINPKGDST
ncbi:MAG: glycosyltransferase family 87 protein [Candidatus Nitrosoglobus sp.]|jgi:hypothetical protein